MKKHYFFTSILAIALFSISSLHAQVNIYTAFGDGHSGAFGGRYDSCEFKQPFAIAMDQFGKFFMSDYGNSLIREAIRTSPNDSLRVYTQAGIAVPGWSGDGFPGTGAAINMPAGIWMSYTGDTVMFADRNNHVIRLMKNGSPSYTIYTIIGTGTVSGIGGDSALASASHLNNPTGVFRDALGNIYIADQGNNKIRMVDHVTKKIYTIAGTGVSGYTGDGGLAPLAKLNAPTQVFVDSSYNVYFSDQGNNVIRKIDPTTGFISTIAGSSSGTAGYSGDGSAATSAKLNGPSGVCVYGSNIYIADQGNNVVRKIDGSGNISTVAGTGTAGYNGDSILATTAQLKSPTGVAVDYTTGFIYIVDAGNNRVRVLRSATSAVPGVNSALKAEVFPNPTTGQFMIKLPLTTEDASVSICNVVGTEIYTSQITNGRLLVNLDAQPAGVYFVLLKSGDATAVQKIVLTK